MKNKTHKKSNAETDPLTIDCLKTALNETQETIRAFDVKSEILAVVLALLISFINLALPEQNVRELFQIYLTATASVMGLLALLFIGFVLYPANNPAELINISNTSVAQTFYVTIDKKSIRLSTYLDSVKRTHWKTEIAYEVLKTAAIRDRKRRWFHWSLILSGLTLLIAIILIVGNLWHG